MVGHPPNKIHSEMKRTTNSRLKQLKKEFRKINKKQFKTMDDVINHLINFFEKRTPKI